MWEDPTWLKLRGWPCVVLGNSPALNEVDLRIFNGIFTLGVNRILRGYRPDGVVVVDTPVVKQEAIRFNAYPGKVLLWEGLRKHMGRLGYTFANTLYWDLAIGKETKDWTWAKEPPGPILRIGTTPAYALQLAVLAGCNPIGVLGVDFTGNSKVSRAGESHFFGNGRKEGATGGGRFIGRNEKFFKEALAWAKSFGVDLYNLSPFDDSPFNACGWERIPAKEFVALARKEVAVK